MAGSTQASGSIAERYDAVVIGSGYGGGVAALRLAEMGRSVAILERGRHIEVGAFPDTLKAGARELQSQGLSGHIGRPDGLFDIRVGDGVSVLVGCGVGGTTLINGNVMLRPESGVFDMAAWPNEFRAERDTLLEEAYQRAHGILRPVPYPGTPPLLKADALSAAADALGETCTYPPVSVTFEDHAGRNEHGVDQPPCTRCGDCCSGCNVGAKNTTAMNYLPAAAQRGAAIVPHCHAVRIQAGKPGEAPWRVVYIRRSEEGQSETERTVAADTVICAAGTLGSTELLLRSAEAGLSLSPVLGQGFSTNGDVIAFSYNNRRPVNGIGVGYPPRAAVEPVGPVIAGLIDLRGSEDIRNNIVIQEGAIPSLLAPLMPAFLSGAVPLFGHRRGISAYWQRFKRYVLSLFGGAYTGAVRNSQTFLVMGHDGADGEMKLESGRLKVIWKRAGKKEIFERIHATLEKASAATNGTFVPNPIWSPALGRNLITVHPLGGCRMGESAAEGVVDHKCRVFDGTGGIHDGLYVVDGSVIPTSLGVNPGLTIAAVAERAMMHLEREPTAARGRKESSAPTSDL